MLLYKDSLSRRRVEQADKSLSIAAICCPSSRLGAVGDLPLCSRQVAALCVVAERVVP